MIPLPCTPIYTKTHLASSGFWFVYFYHQNIAGLKQEVFELKERDFFSVQYLFHLLDVFLYWWNKVDIVYNESKNFI